MGTVLMSEPPVTRSKTSQISSVGQSASPGYVLHLEPELRLQRLAAAAAISSPKAKSSACESSRVVRLARTSSVSWKALGSSVSRTSSPAGETVDSSAAAAREPLATRNSENFVPRQLRDYSPTSLPSTRMVCAETRLARGSALARSRPRAREAMWAILPCIKSAR